MWMTSSAGSAVLGYRGIDWRHLAVVPADGIGRGRTRVHLLPAVQVACHTPRRDAWTAELWRAKVSPRWQFTWSCGSRKYIEPSPAQHVACYGCAHHLVENRASKSGDDGDREVVSRKKLVAVPESYTSGKPSSSLWRREEEEEGGEESSDVINGPSSAMTRRSVVSGLACIVTTIAGTMSLERAEAGAIAMGDGSSTQEAASRAVTPRGKLPQGEMATVELFERSTYSVANIFDVTLRPQANMSGSVEVPEGNGSGLVWDDQGHVVTNYHVIGNALQFKPSRGTSVARVTLLSADGSQKTYEGVLVGADKKNDLAVLKIDAPSLQLRPIPLGRSSALRVGQRCLAIGNPFGFDHTLTTGVISGLERDIQSQTGIVIGGGVQTDAAINPGNSGGPLLDSKGQLIGINTAIFTKSGTSSGIGFAIPVDSVARIVPQLISQGRVLHPSLNVQFAPEAAARQLSIATGALVLAVPSFTGAFKAGLLPTRRGLGGNIIPGDVIVAVDGVSIRGQRDLDKFLQTRDVGERVVLRVQREKEVADLPVILEEEIGS